MLKIILHICLTFFLTLVTQIGGLAWLIALFFKRSLLVFLCIYTAFMFSAALLAPMFGRTALPCFSEAGLRMQSMFYCVTNRHYVTPELHHTLKDLSAYMEQALPGTDTLVLDAGFPLLPHLSHDDGEKGRPGVLVSGCDRDIPAPADTITHWVFYI